MVRLPRGRHLCAPWPTHRLWCKGEDGPGTLLLEWNLRGVKQGWAFVGAECPNEHSRSQLGPHAVLSSKQDGRVGGGCPDIWLCGHPGRRRGVLSDSAGWALPASSVLCTPSCFLGHTLKPHCVVGPGFTVLLPETSRAPQPVVGQPCWKAGSTHHAQHETPMTIQCGPKPTCSCAAEGEAAMGTVGRWQQPMQARTVSDVPDVVGPARACMLSLSVSNSLRTCEL